MFRRLLAFVAIPLVGLLILPGIVSGPVHANPYFFEPRTGAIDATSDAYAEDSAQSAQEGPTESWDYWWAEASAYASVPSAVGFGRSTGRLNIFGDSVGLDLFSESFANDATSDAWQSSASGNVSTQDPWWTNGLFVGIGGDTPGQPVWVTYEVSVDATTDIRFHWPDGSASGGYHLGGGRDQGQPPAITLNQEIPVWGGYDPARAVWQYSGPYGYHQWGPLTWQGEGGFGARVGDQIGLHFNAGAWADAWGLDSNAQSQTSLHLRMNLIPPTEWYVDAANGTDDTAHGWGPGTDAWKTIHYAVDQINDMWPPGGVHILHVAEGLYDYAHESSGNYPDPGDPIYVNRSHVVIRGNGGSPNPRPALQGLLGVWGVGFAIHGDHVTVENLDLSSFDLWDSAIEVYGDHAEIKDCEIHDNDAPGIYVGWARTGTVIRGNLIHSNYMGIEAWDPDGLLIERNEIRDATDEAVMISNFVEGRVPAVIRNNVISNTYRGIFLENNSGSTYRALIYHNTIDTGWAGIDSYFADPEIKYNIITNFSYGVYRDSAGEPVLDYNDVWNNATNYSPSSLQGPHDIQSDPLYKDPGGADYTLQAGSPCINAIPLGAGDPLTEDLLGNPRPMGSGFDIGAYEAPYTVSVFVSPAGGGTVTLDPGGILIPPNAGGSYPEGTPVTLTPAPNAGYRFKEWLGACTGSGPCAFIVDSDKSVTAVFIKQWTLTMNLGAGGASVSPGTGVYDQGPVQISAAALPDYVFLNWSGDYTGSDNPATILLNSDMNVTANFALAQYTLTTNVSPAGAGSVVLNPPGGIYNAGTPVQIAANANPGYRFGNWSGDHTGSTNPDTVTMTSNKTVTANFVPQYELVALVSPEGTGTVDPSGGTYDHGTVVNPVPTPNEGYVFDRWVGDCNGDTCSLTMDSMKTIVAYFKEVQTGEPSLLVPAGATELDYKMVSVPVDPADPSPSSVFGWGTSYNPAAMRVLRWDPSGANYLEGNAIPPVNLGVGYWLISQADRTLTVNGNVIPSDMDYYILLLPGWNQIGPPYPVDTVPWADGYMRVYVPSTQQELDISDAGAFVENQAWGFDHGYFGASSLVPWSGYWVNNVGAEPVYLILNASGEGGSGLFSAKGLVESGASGSSRSGPTSGISFNLQYKGYSDRTLFLGIDPAASAGLDLMDAASPPRFLMSYPRIYVNHPDWPRPGAYAKDVRPLGAQPVEFLITIDLPQSSGKKAKATSMTLSWSGVQGLPADASVKLVDPQKKGKKGTLDMRTRSQYTIKAKKGATQYQLKVVIQ